jgi:ADP-ribose pyrophosphatase YjhB (NUDIX family)
VSTEPRIRVSAILRWRGSVLLCRHEKQGQPEHWLLPGGGVNSGESLVDALYRELAEELGIDDEPPVEGPVAIVDSISPDAAVRGHRLFTPDELDEIALHPPIQRFLQRWNPGDPAVYLGALWAR